MARSTRSAKLETRTARLKLAVRKKPYFVAVAPGVGLGYRRNKTAGSWVVRAADGKGGNWTQAFAVADDFEDANGADVLSFWQAQDQARVLARGGGDADEDSGKPVTVAQMIDRYETDLKARGGDVYNAQRIRVHLPDVLASKTVALLAAPREFRHWRDGARSTEPAPPSRPRSSSLLLRTHALRIRVRGGRGSQPCLMRSNPGTSSCRRMRCSASSRRLTR